MMRTRAKAVAAILLLAGLAIVVLVVARPDAPRDDLETGVDPRATASAREAGSTADTGETPKPEPPEEDTADTGAPEPAGPAASGTGRIVVEVVDADGRPVRGASVRMGGAPTTGLRLALGVTPEPGTDDRGRLEIDGRPEGEHPITVSAPGFLDAVTQARPVGGVVRVRLDRAFTISGKVIDGTTRKGVAGVILTARPVDVPDSGPALGAVSRADGSFTFEKVPPGQHVIRIGSRAKLSSAAAADFLPLWTGPIVAGSEGLEIVLTRGLHISGRIENLGTLGFGEFVSIEVMGLLPDGKQDTTRSWFASAAPDGSFRVGGLPEGLYRLRFVPHTNLAAALAPTTVRTVSAGTEGLVVRMNQGLTISGRVEDDGGNPVTTGGAVYVYATGTLPGQGDCVVVKAMPDGTFATVALEPGRTYEILATGFSGCEAAQVEAVAPGAREVVIVLRRALRITGKVLDEDGKPVPMGVGVTATTAGTDGTDPRARSTAYTGHDGTFALEGLGGFEYRVRAGGGRSAFRAGEPIENVRPGPDPIVLRVKKGVSLAGRLVDAEGRAVKTNIVTGHQSEEAVAPWTGVMDDRGRFVLTGLAPGKVRLSAYLDGTYVALGEFVAPATDLVITVPSR